MFAVADALLLGPGSAAGGADGLAPGDQHVDDLFGLIELPTGVEAEIAGSGRACRCGVGFPERRAGRGTNRR